MNNEKAINRIKKCLALSKSSNPNEAAQAIKMAQKLMSQHNVDEFDVRVSKEGSKLKLNMKLQAHVDQLLSFVASAFGCSIVLRSEYTLAKKYNNLFGVYQTYPKYHRIAYFIGESSSAKIAVYAFENLYRLMNEARKEFMSSIHGNSKKKTKSEKSDAYALGWVISVGRKLPSMDVCDATEVDKAAYMTKHFGELTDAEARSVDEQKFMNQMSDGYVAGLNVNVHSGVDGSNDDSSPKLITTVDQLASERL